MQLHKLMLVQCFLRVCPTMIVNKLDLVRARAKTFNHRADLSTIQAPARYGLGECDNGSSSISGIILPPRSRNK